MKSTSETFKIFLIHLETWQNIATSSAARACSLQLSHFSLLSRKISHFCMKVMSNREKINEALNVLQPFLQCSVCLMKLPPVGCFWGILCRSKIKQNWECLMEETGSRQKLRIKCIFLIFWKQCCNPPQLSWGLGWKRRWVCCLVATLLQIFSLRKNLLL